MLNEILTIFPRKCGLFGKLDNAVGIGIFGIPPSHTGLYIHTEMLTLKKKISFALIQFSSTIFCFEI